MIKEQLETNFAEVKDSIKENWKSLNDEDINQINGRYENFVKKLQQKYGISRERAEEEIRNWQPERFRTLGKDRVFGRDANDVRENTTWKAKNADTHSFLKGLLTAGIPLLLLSGYLANENSKIKNDALARTEISQPGQSVAGSAADQAILQDLRSDLFSAGSLASYKNAIRLESNNGVVTIRGTVATAQEREAVSQIARETSGVRQVNNLLTIR